MAAIIDKIKIAITDMEQAIGLEQFSLQTTGLAEPTDISQWSRHVGQMLDWSWATVCDAGPTLIHNLVSV